MFRNMHFRNDVAESRERADREFLDFCDKTLKTLEEAAANMNAAEEGAHYEIVDVGGNLHYYAQRIHYVDISKPPRMITLLDKNGQVVALWNIDQIARIDLVYDVRNDGGN